MNLLYSVNYLIFAAFMTLLIIELGISIYGIFSYRRYRERIRQYLLPVWEVIGTFAALYVVNFVVTYPTLVPTISIFLLPAMAAGVLFLLRGIFLVYSEWVGEAGQEGSFFALYSAAVFVIFVLVFSILTSAMSGIGINANATGIFIPQMVASPFNIAMVLSAVMISVFVASNLFGGRREAMASIAFAAIAYVIIIAALNGYASGVFDNILGNVYLLGVSFVLFVVAAALLIANNRLAKHFMLIWLFGSINLLGVAEYPYLIAGHDVSVLIASGSLAQGAVLVTSVGGLLVLIALVLFVYLNYIRRSY